MAWWRALSSTVRALELPTGILKNIPQIIQGSQLYRMCAPLLILRQNYPEPDACQHSAQSRRNRVHKDLRWAPCLYVVHGGVMSCIWVVVKIMVQWSLFGS